MKYKTVVLLLLIAFFGCKPMVTSDIETVVGTAKNEKYGAVLHANNAVFAIAGLKSWDSIYLNKKVSVKGNFELRVGDDKVEIKNLGTFQAQSYPKYYLVKDAVWELYCADK